jgi:U6 snRNA-associated Sm-like protein LSm6
MSTGEGRDPSGFLSEIIGAPVTVKLNSGIVYKGMLQPAIRFCAVNDPAGELQSVDGYMNIALEQAKEYVDGKLHRSYGDAFIRGNNGKRSFNLLNGQNLIACYSYVYSIKSRLRRER